MKRKLLLFLALTLAFVCGSPAQTPVSVTVTAIDSSTPPQTVTQTFTTTLNPAPVPPLAIITTSLPAFTLTQPATCALASTGGTPPITWTAAGLPQGVTLGSNGACAGTPAAALGSTGASGSTAAPGAAVVGYPLTPSGVAAAFPGVAVGVDTSLVGTQVFGPGYLLNQSVANAPVDPSSASVLSVFGGGITFCECLPYNVVDSRVTPFQPVIVTNYVSEADLVQVPLPANPAFEAGSDHHLLVFDIATGNLFEMDGWMQDANGNALPAGSPPSAQFLCYFPGTSAPGRPYTWTSADAAGLSVFHHTLGYDEAAAGTINHALRGTMNHTMAATFVAPATHSAGDLHPGATGIPPAGAVFRLKASWTPTSPLSTINQNIVKALQTYGWVVADNGITGAIQKTPDPRWDPNDDQALNAQLSMSDFDLVSTGPTYTYATGAYPNEPTNVPSGPGPTIASFTEATTGNTATFTWSVSGATYFYLLNYVPLAGNTISIPYIPGTYTLVANNQFGSTTASVTVQ